MAGALVLVQLGELGAGLAERVQLGASMAHTHDAARGVSAAVQRGDRDAPDGGPRPRAGPEPQTEALTALASPGQPWAYAKSWKAPGSARPARPGAGR
jgi:hypothetical protein